jgi:hypothetical protein
LSDKEWQEIKSFLAEHPEAKHRLSFWHCLRATNKPLSIFRRSPAFYHVEDAMREFLFIDKSSYLLAKGT